MVFSCVALRAKKAVPIERNGRFSLRGGRRRKREREEKEEDEKEDEEEVVGLRASPARVGAYIDHERVYDIREYIIRGL